MAVDDHVDIDYRTGIVIQVLENDTDPDGDPLQISAVGDPEHGTTDINYNNDGTGGPLHTMRTATFSETMNSHTMSLTGRVV